MIKNLHYLSLLLVPVILTLTFVYHDDKVRYYVPISCSISALIIFLNFPSIVIFLHSKPVYYDDLVIKNYEEETLYTEDFRRKYQHIFRWITTFTSALVVGITSELWYYRDRIFTSDSTTSSSVSSAQDKVFKAFVLIGVIGGLVRIYYGAAMLLGQILLVLLKRFKRKEQERRRQQAEERTMIELTSIGVSIGQEDDDRPLIIRASSHNDMGGAIKPLSMFDIFNDDLKNYQME